MYTNFRKKSSWSNQVEELCLDVDSTIKIKMAYFFAKHERLPAMILMLSVSGIAILYGFRKIQGTSGD
jgi:hypothetical protein